MAKTYTITVVSVYQNVPLKDAQQWADRAFSTKACRQSFSIMARLKMVWAFMEGKIVSHRSEDPNGSGMTATTTYKLEAE